MVRCACCARLLRLMRWFDGWKFVHSRSTQLTRFACRAHPRHLPRIHTNTHVTTPLDREPPSLPRNITGDTAKTCAIRRGNLFISISVLTQTGENPCKPTSNSPSPILPPRILTDPKTKENDISIGDPAPTVPLWSAVAGGDEDDLVPVCVDGGPGVAVECDAGHWIWLGEFDEGEDVTWEGWSEDEET